MTEIYKHITETIKASDMFVDGHTLPAHMALFNNQYNREEEDIPYNRPAVFVEILPIKWERKNGIKRGTAEVVVHIVQDCFMDAVDGDPQEPDYLKLLEYPELIDDILENSSGDTFGSPLENIATDPDTDHGNLLIIKQRYSCVVERAVYR